MAGLREESFLLKNLENLFGSSDNLKAYQKLKTNSERLDNVYHTPIIQDLFKLQHHALKKAHNEGQIETQGVGKSESETTRWRELGNQSFKTGKDNKALEHYSLAMLYAPKPYEKCGPKKKNGFTLAIANRSAVHVRLNNFIHAIKDIDVALKIGDHPTPFKLYERRAQCNEHLHNFDQASIDLKDAIKSLEADGDAKNGPKIKEIEQKVKDLSESGKVIEQNGKAEEDPSPWPNFRPNPNYPGLSENIKVLYTKERGRYGVAAKDIQVGEAIAIESPTATRLKSIESADHCDTCLNYCFGSQVPCPKCVTSCFCSLECLEKAQQTYHKHECLATGGIVSNFLEDFLVKVKGPEGAVDFYRLVFRLVSQSSLDFFKKNRDWIDKSDELFGIKDGEVFLPGDYKSTMSLVRHVDSDTTGVLFWVILSSAFLLRTLQLSGYFGPKRHLAHWDIQLDEDELLIGEVIVHLFQLLRYNCHGILEQVCIESDLKSEEKDFHWQASWRCHNIATGIFPCLALLNHSCDPNISKYFVGPTVIAVANRVIFEGEELTENYYPYFTHMPRVQRLPWLLEHYRFQCGCIACLKDFPTRPEMCDSDFYFRCPKCNSEMPKVTQKSKVRCPECGNDLQDVDKLSEQVKSLQQEISQSERIKWQDINNHNLVQLTVETQQRLDQLSRLVCNPTKALQDSIEWYSALIRRLYCSKRASKLK